MNSSNKWAAHISSSGFAYEILERPMPRVDDEILETIVYMYPSEADALDGAKSGGTGFLIGIPVPFQQPAPAVILCIVTNRHVVAAGSTTVRLNNERGGLETVDLDNAKWYYHPEGDDLCLCPIRMGSGLKQKYISMGQIVGRDLAKTFDIGIGDEVFFAGRFVSLDGKQQNRPSIRFGNIAQMPNELVPQQDGTKQESIIVEARSIPGFSGSPVFFYMMPEPHLPQYEKEFEDIMRKSRFFNNKRWPSGIQIGPLLIGVDYCNIFERDPVISAATDKQMHDWHVQSNTGMMGIVPAWRIWDIVDGTEMKKLRQEAESELNMKKAQSNAKINFVPSSRADSTKGENATHLEDFKSLLNAVAKTPPQGD